MSHWCNKHCTEKGSDPFLLTNITWTIKIIKHLMIRIKNPTSVHKYIRRSSSLIQHNIAHWRPWYVYFALLLIHIQKKPRREGIHIKYYNNIIPFPSYFFYYNFCYLLFVTVSITKSVNSERDVVFFLLEWMVF